MPPRLITSIRLSQPKCRRYINTMPILVPPIHEEDLSKFLVENDGHWRLSFDQLGIERGVVFATFVATRRFIEEICSEAQRMKHHPEWANVRPVFRVYLRDKFGSLM